MNFCLFFLVVYWSGRFIFNVQVKVKSLISIMPLKGSFERHIIQENKKIELPLPNSIFLWRNMGTKQIYRTILLIL